MNVWTLHIHHEYGDDVTVYADEADAQAALDAYVRDWWERETCLDLDQMPTDPNEAAQQYFEAAEGRVT